MIHSNTGRRTLDVGHWISSATLAYNTVNGTDQDAVPSVSRFPLFMRQEKVKETVEAERSSTKALSNQVEISCGYVDARLRAQLRIQGKWTLPQSNYNTSTPRQPVSMPLFLPFLAPHPEQQEDYVDIPFIANARQRIDWPRGRISTDPSLKLVNPRKKGYQT